MVNVRHALSGLPSKPGFVIAAILIALLGGWYLSSTWSRCTALSAGRQQLKTAIERAGPGGVLDLAAALPGNWDEVRIVQGHRLAEGTRAMECPFGWDLSQAERNALIAAGDYTLIGLFTAGQFQRYVEWRRDWARFEGDVRSLAAAAARFTVSRDGAAYVLTPVSP